MSIRLLDETDKQELIEMIGSSGGSNKVVLAEASGKIVHVDDAKPIAVQSLKLYDSEGDEIQTAINIAIANKNLFRIDLLPNSVTNKGITFTKNEDGSITANGTSSGTYASNTCTLDKNIFAVGNTYTISSGKTSGYLYVQLILNYADGTTDYLVSRNSPATFKLSKTVNSVTASVQITDSGITLNNETIRPMLELSDVASSFEKNVYQQITFNEGDTPVLPDNISNVWANNDTVANIKMTYVVDMEEALKKLNSGVNKEVSMEAVVDELQSNMTELTDRVDDLTPDTSLAILGRPADAKATGEKISEVNANLQEVINGLRTSLLSSVYPIGSIYMSISPTEPSTLFGGTWTQIKDAFLFANGNDASTWFALKADDTITANSVKVYMWKRTA